jgi:hypothetical protein
MNKVIIIVSADGEANVYDIVPPATAASIAAQSGVTDPAFYQEFPESDFDEACYNYPEAFSLSAGVVSFSLDAAKARASQLEKDKYSAAEAAATTGFSANQLASQSSLDPVDRLPDIQAVLDTVNVLAVDLNDKLTQIAVATTIDEVNNIAYPPYGILFTGRGDGLGPEDLNVSYYTEFNSVSLTEAETELYVPGTDTVLPYTINPEIHEGGFFDSTVNCFNPGDYLIQIRQVSNSSVIAEFEVPLAPAGVDVPFNQPLEG